MGPFLLTRRAPTTRRSALPPLGIFVAVAVLLALLLGGSVALAVLNPGSAMLLVGMLVSLAVTAFASFHAVLLTTNGVAANAWLSVPALVGLLGVALVAGPQVLRYLSPLISES
jgi:hypothetical protein